MELGPDPADRPVGLGSQEDGEQPGPERHRAVGEPQPDADGDDGDRDRGEELESGGGEEGDPQRAHRGAAVLLADLGDDLDLALGPAVADEGGQPPHDVEEVAGQGGEGRPPPFRVGLGGAADEGGEERQERQGEDDDQGAQPVDPQQGGDGERRHRDPGDECRQEAGGVRLDRGGALGGEGHPTVGVGATLGRDGEPAGEQVLAQGGRHLHPGPGGRPLGDPRQRGARGEESGQPRRRATEGRPVDDRDDQGGEREGRRDRRERPGARRPRPGRRPAGEQPAPSSAAVGRRVSSGSRHLGVSGRTRRPGCAGSRSACGRCSRSTRCRGARSG